MSNAGKREEWRAHNSRYVEQRPVRLVQRRFVTEHILINIPGRSGISVTPLGQSGMPLERHNKSED
jgi:hypothetical protein